MWGSAHEPALGWGQGQGTGFPAFQIGVPVSCAKPQSLPGLRDWGMGATTGWGAGCRLDAGDDPHNPLMLGGAELQCAENCSED